MDTVFVDTSVVISNKYFHPQSIVTALGKLAYDGQLHIVIPEITAEEIRKHFEKDMRECLVAMSKHSSMFRHCDEVFHSIEIDKQLERAMKRVEGFFDLPNVEILPFDTDCNLRNVFQAYFKEEPPFHLKNKKYEFPDAFVIEILKEYAIKHKTKIICFSQDGDFKVYENEWLQQADIKEYVSRKQKETENIRAFETVLNHCKNGILHEVKEKIYEHLDNERLYYNLGNISVNGIDVLSVSLDMAQEDYIIFKNTQKEMLVTVPVSVDFKIEISYDNYDMAFYDREDEQWYNVQNNEHTYDNVANIYLSLRYDKTGMFPEQAEISIEDIDYSEVDELFE